MSGTMLLTRTFDALASLRLAVLTMLALGSTCAWATFYEMQHGTEAAQRDVYRTPYFALVLVTLGANIFCAMMKRYPWTKHHAGFVLAHIGILTLLAGSLISLHYGLDSNLPLYEGETGDRVVLLDRALMATLPEGASAQFPVTLERDSPRAGHERRFRIPGSDATLVAEDYYAHAIAKDRVVEGDAENPALHLALKGPFGAEDFWLVARDRERSHVDLGPASFAFHEAKDAAEADALLSSVAFGRNQVSFVRLPGAGLRYAIATRSGPGPRGAAQPGEVLTTPWMGMTVAVDRLVEKAALTRDVETALAPEKDSRRTPAVKVHLESAAGRSPSEWLLFSEALRVPFAGRTATLAYRSPEAQLPFRVTLLDFNSDKYPGSNMPATYESWVRVDDPERGSSEHHVSMNHPLHYRGYIFFQASFVEGEPMMSIFSVARAPGLPLVYAGVTLIGMGVAWMFYLKPYLARRQARAALFARLGEKKHEEGVAAAVPAPAARPAESGA